MRPAFKTQVFLPEPYLPMNGNAGCLVPRPPPARIAKPGWVRGQPNRKLVLLPQGPLEGQDRFSGTYRVEVPGSGRPVSTSTHQQ